ncbi:MAG: LysE family translocator [Neisseriaceae bacterium]|jgi:RhtB (resistance to homoserine/threonine) family protein|nr:MAG: LysE family translocator [Neisseriaceae bacterium]
MTQELYTVVSIATLAVISPGSDFAIVTKNTIVGGRSSGYSSALGIALSTWIHTLYCIVGVALILSQSPILFNIIKIIGVCYLLYIGITTFLSKFESSPDGHMLNNKQQVINSFKQGFLSNVTNPKTTLFYLSLFSMVINKNTGLSMQLMYGLVICLLHLVWFCLISYLISHPNIKHKFDRNVNTVNKIVGVLLVLIALKIIMTVSF